MKRFSMALMLYVSALFGMDETGLREEIAKSRSIEVLSQQMQEAPKEYRHYYIEAIKRLVVEENELKQQEMLESLRGRRGHGGRGNGGGGGGRGGK